jgi:hypothetical protein
MPSWTARRGAVAFPVRIEQRWNRLDDIDAHESATQAQPELLAPIEESAI